MMISDENSGRFKLFYIKPVFGRVRYLLSLNGLPDTRRILVVPVAVEAPVENGIVEVRWPSELNDRN